MKKLKLFTLGLVMCFSLSLMTACACNTDEDKTDKANQENTDDTDNNSKNNTNDDVNKDTNKDTNKDAQNADETVDTSKEPMTTEDGNVGSDLVDTVDDVGTDIVDGVTDVGEDLVGDDTTQTGTPSAKPESETP